MKLVDCVKMLRSKNAGPLFLTLDIIFQNQDDMQKILPQLTPERIADAYEMAVEDVVVIPYEIVNSIKITFPRKMVSGCVAEDDVYGCQQHLPLANLEVEM